MIRCISIAKIGESTINEDAVKKGRNWIAVSDGAGGGGVYADRWSQYLLDCLPTKSIVNFSQFDSWIDGIWESFYNEYEEKAKLQGGMFLNKFYDEGSFATLVTVWRTSKARCKWMSYGDSAAFCYNRKTGVLEHSYTKLADFNSGPYLVCSKEPLVEEGFRSGTFAYSKDCVVFVASDALAHYILMMYEVSKRGEYEEELSEAIDAHTRNSNYISVAMAEPVFKFSDVIETLLEASKDRDKFTDYLSNLLSKGIIGLDDYSIAVM